MLVNAPKVLGEQYELAFKLALEGDSRSAATWALEAWVESCVKAGVAQDQPHPTAALTQCARILEQGVPEIGRMPSDDDASPGAEAKGLCEHFVNAMDEVVVPFDWPKTCATAGVKQPVDSRDLHE